MQKHGLKKIVFLITALRICAYLAYKTVDQKKLCKYIQILTLLIILLNYILTL